MLMVQGNQKTPDSVDMSAVKGAKDRPDLNVNQYKPSK